MKNDGLIQWNAIASCEMFKTPWQMGRHVMKDDSETTQWSQYSFRNDN